jgi:hypothetical protein
VQLENTDSAKVYLHGLSATKHQMEMILCFKRRERAVKKNLKC